jgi:hypothetical protein
MARGGMLGAAIAATCADCIDPRYLEAARRPE